jgi:hypothetical protein
LVSIATCDFRFSLQNRYASASLVTRLAPLGVTNDVITVGGYAMLAGKTTGRQAFVSASRRDIRKALKTYRTTLGPLRPDTLVILDMEPKKVAPRNLGEFGGADLRELVRAYVQRIEIARQEFLDHEPSVRIGLYQVIVPDGRGQLTEEFAKRLCGSIAAGRLGMYDELDFICPVLYQRFGPEDPNSGSLGEWIAAATQQAIDGSLALARSDGTPVPLVPVLGFWVFNGNSQSDRKAVAPKRLGRQLELVQAATGINAVVFWSGWETKEEMENAKKPVEGIDIVKFLGRTGALPWPGCT